MQPISAFACECQEEGGWEYISNHGGSKEGHTEAAAYHPGSKPASEEAHLEPAILVQPLGESASESEASREKSNLAVLCQGELAGHAEPSQHGACARYAHWYSGIEHWVDKHIVKPVEHFVQSVEKFGGELIENLHGRCYPQNLRMGGQCFSKGPFPDEPPPAFP